MKELFRQLLPGLRAVAVFTVLLGLAYPLVITGISQLAMNRQANGSMVEVAGRQASVHLAQNFTGDQWLQPRPSAAKNSDDANDPGWNGLYSAGTNAGPNSTELTEEITARRAELARVNGVPADQVPAEALTSSASGLDPDISPEYAEQQVNRIAAARHISPDAVRHAIAQGSHGRALGFLGEPTVNVVEVNAALARG